MQIEYHPRIGILFVLVEVKKVLNGRTSPDCYKTLSVGFGESRPFDLLRCNFSFQETGTFNRRPIALIKLGGLRIQMNYQLIK